MLQDAMHTRHPLISAMPSSSVQLQHNSEPGSFDPRPPVNSAAAAQQLVDRPFTSFFHETTYSGAFDPAGITWLHGWSFMDLSLIHI